MLVTSHQASVRRKTLKSEVPSTGEYTLEGVKISLDLLRHAAGLVPVPYVRFAVETAISVIKMGEDMRSTLQLVDDLNRRVWALMLVMITPLQGKLPQEIPPELQKDIEHVASDLRNIEKTLKRIAAQCKIWTFLFPKPNEEKVKDCMSRLDESLNRFQVSREINNAIVQWEMATGIEESVKATKQVLTVTQETNFIVKNLKNAAQLMDEFHNASKHAPHHASPLSSREMPTQPRFFYGRDDIVNVIVDTLLNKEHRQTHIALLGTGGIGKTSIAIAVMRHTCIVKKFGDRLFWIPCVEGRSPTRFLDILLSCLRITRDTGDPLSDILYELKAFSDPRVILLDNFETPWNLDGYQAEIEKILCALAALPHITLLITMRSKQPPSDNIQWYCPSITSLDYNEARRIYYAIYSNAHWDPALEELLAELGYMPLAITLMAQVGKKSGSAPGDLLQAWRNESIRTSMLKGIDISISLSVHSAPMMANPEAITLLATLAMFPAGTQSKHLARWAPSILNIPGALTALADASLADYDQKTLTIRVHPVIRSYMLHPQRLSDTIRSNVRDAIYLFMADHKSQPGDPTFFNDARELANEETNIQSILLDAIKEDFHDNAATAVITYCWYQHWTRPRLDVIESVLAASRSSKKASYIAEGLFCLGNMYTNLDYDKKAAAALVEAKDMFDTVGLKSKATQCSIKLAVVYAFLHDTDAYRDAVKDALRDLEELDDETLIADVLLCVARYNWFIRMHTEARESLAQAQRIYLRLNHWMGIAHCNYWISRTHYSEGNYNEARGPAEAAALEYERLDHRDSAAEALIHLGRILKCTGWYDEASHQVRKGLCIYQSIGAPGGIAQGWEVLGQIYTKMEQYDDAHSAYKMSLETFRSIAGRTWTWQYGIALCLYGIAEIYRYQKRFEDEERMKGEYEEIGIDVVNNRNWS